VVIEDDILGTSSHNKSHFVKEKEKQGIARQLAWCFLVQHPIKADIFVVSGLLMLRVIWGKIDSPSNSVCCGESKLMG
jgi:hypothetical protein